MKHQYFGDDRDLFKFDLVYELSKGCDLFVYIPMITKGQGDKTDRNKAGKENTPLKDFLNENVELRQSTMHKLVDFFKNQGIDIRVLPPTDRRYFTSKGRRTYFQEVENGLHEVQKKSLILVDPDKGLAEPRSDREHLLFGEVRDNLYGPMNSDSVLMVFQYLPHIGRKEYPDYLKGRLEYLKKEISGCHVNSIHDNEIAFLFLTKRSEIFQSLDKILRNYKEKYRGLVEQVSV